MLPHVTAGRGRGSSERYRFRSAPAGPGNGGRGRLQAVEENQIEKEISTEKYIDDLKQELNIKDINQQLDRTLPDEEYINTEKKEEKPGFGKTAD